MIFFKNIKIFNELLNLKPILFREPAALKPGNSILSDDEMRQIKELSDKTDELYFQSVFNSLLKSARIRKPRK